jgi:hypothetical protein
MRETGADMKRKYKETSRGSLVASVIALLKALGTEARRDLRNILRPVRTLMFNVPCYGPEACLSGNSEAGVVCGHSAWAGAGVAGCSTVMP